MRINGANGGTVYANLLQAHGASPGLRLLNSGGPLALGINYLGGLTFGPAHSTENLHRLPDKPQWPRLSDLYEWEINQYRHSGLLLQQSAHVRPQGDNGVG
jgi:hypothetical protein